MKCMFVALYCIYLVFASENPREATGKSSLATKQALYPHVGPFFFASSQLARKLLLAILHSIYIYL